MSGCIEAEGTPNNSGYCSVWYNGQRIGAHRAAYIESNGEIPEGCVVMHSCDNRRCVNPEHLSVGSQSDNLRDMVDKGRAPARDHTGINNPNCRTTKEMLETILTSPLSSIKLAKEIPLSAAQIRATRRKHNV